MSKHRKRAAPTPSAKPPGAGPAPSLAPSARRPALLVVSVILFILWFLFLLVTARTSGGF